MARRIVSWRGSETRVSPSLPVSAVSPVSVVAIDSISAPQNPPTMSQATAEVPVTQAGGLEVDALGLAGISATANLTTDDAFPRHDTYFFKDGNITFLVCKMLYGAQPTEPLTIIIGRWHALLRSPILFRSRLGLFFL